MSNANKPTYIQLFGRWVPIDLVQDENIGVMKVGGSIRRPTDEEMLGRLMQSHHYLLPARIFSNSPLNAETLTAAIKKAQEAQAAAEPVFEQGTLVGASDRAVWAQAVKEAAARGLKVSPKPFFAPMQPGKPD